MEEIRSTRLRRSEEDRRRVSTRKVAQHAQHVSLSIVERGGREGSPPAFRIRNVGSMQDLLFVWGYAEDPPDEIDVGSSFVRETGRSQIGSNAFRSWDPCPSYESQRKKKENLETRNPESIVIEHNTSATYGAQERVASCVSQRFVRLREKGFEGNGCTSFR